MVQPSKQNDDHLLLQLLQYSLNMSITMTVGHYVAERHVSPTAYVLLATFSA